MLGECLATSSIYRGFKRYKEVSYYEILRIATRDQQDKFITDYLAPSIATKELKRWKADWVIQSVAIVIEVQGKQHKSPVAFDGNPIKATQRFLRQQQIDRDKKYVCSLIGWKFVLIDAEQMMKIPMFDRTAFVEDVINDTR
jgi:hypothetical protein